MGSGTNINNPNRAGFLCRLIRRNGRTLTLRGLIGIRFDPGIKGRKDIDKIKVILHGSPDFPVEARFSPTGGFPFIRGFRVYACKISIDLEDALGLDLQNRLDLYYDGNRMCSILYNLMWRGPVEFCNSRLFPVENKVMYFRQTVKNTTWFVVRPHNLYDDTFQKYRVFLAWVVSRFRTGSDHILMYEKEASRYEESASVLYEALMDRGYDNVYYIIDRNNSALDRLPEIYRKNMIFKDSFRHLVYFLSCKTFIGTENIDHAMQLRAANRHLMKKMQSRDLTHVFLQHGVVRAGLVAVHAVESRIVVDADEVLHTLLVLRKQDKMPSGFLMADRPVGHDIGFHADDSGDAFLHTLLVELHQCRHRTMIGHGDMRETERLRLLHEVVDLQDGILDRSDCRVAMQRCIHFAFIAPFRIQLSN